MVKISNSIDDCVKEGDLARFMTKKMTEYYEGTVPTTDMVVAYTLIFGKRDKREYCFNECRFRKCEYKYKQMT